MIAFPLGGVGAGCISLGGRGQLRDWEIFNRSEKGRRPRYCFASIWAQAAGQKPVASILESRLQPPFEGAEGPPEPEYALLDGATMYYFAAR